MAKHWTTKELLEAGLTERGINRSLNEGTLYRLCRGIYTEERPDPESALRALQHRYRGIIFTGVTAAGVYGLMPIAAPAFGNLRHGSIALHNDVLHASPSRKRGRRRINGIDVDTPVAVAAAIRATHDF